MESPPSARLSLVSENEGTDRPLAGEITECKCDPTAHFSLDKQNLVRWAGRVRGTAAQLGNHVTGNRAPSSPHLTATVFTVWPVLLAWLPWTDARHDTQQHPDPSQSSSRTQECSAGRGASNRTETQRHTLSSPPPRSGCHGEFRIDLMLTSVNATVLL